MLREMINYSMIAEKKIKKQFIFTYIYFITTYISRNIQKLNDLVIVYFCWSTQYCISTLLKKLIMIHLFQMVIKDPFLFFSY